MEYLLKNKALSSIKDICMFLHFNYTERAKIKNKTTATTILFSFVNKTQPTDKRVNGSFEP